MNQKLLTKEEKIERAKKVRDLMLSAHRSEEKTEVFWENVYQRAVWILED